MGQICDCGIKSPNPLGIQGHYATIRDPRLQEVVTHMKMLDSKLNSNIISIEDFIYLISETRKEPIQNKEISSVLQQVEQQLTDSKVLLEEVITRRNGIKDTMEQVDQKGRQQRKNGSSTPSSKTNGQQMFEPASIDTETKSMIEQIYKKISEVLKMVRKAEEDAQESMLKWENFIIQHEKMRKYRCDIIETLKSSGDKLQEIQEKHKEFKDRMSNLQKICNILDACQQEQNFTLSNDDESTDFPRQNSVINQDSFDDEEKEMQLEDLVSLKEKIQMLQQKLEIAERDLEKKQNKLTVLKLKKEEVNDYDIYELDSYHKKLNDYLNALEISLYKLNQQVTDLKTKHDAFGMIDLFENIICRKKQILGCRAIIEKTIKQFNKLQTGVSVQFTQNSHQQQNGGSSSKINQRLQNLINLKESMDSYIKRIANIEKMNINVKDIEHIESVMLQLSQIDKEYLEDFRNSFDEVIIAQKIKVIGGSLGKKMELESICLNKTKQISKFKRTLDGNHTQLIEQQELLSELTNRDNDDCSAHKEQIEKYLTHNQKLFGSLRKLVDQLNEIETCIDRISSSSKSAYIHIKEGESVDDQEWEVQELISIMMSIANFRFFEEKLIRNTDKNKRLIKRIEIKMIENNAAQTLFQLKQQLETAKELSDTANQKLKQHYQLTTAIFRANQFTPEKDQMIFSKESSPRAADERQNKINKAQLSLTETQQTCQKQGDMLAQNHKRLHYHTVESVIGYQDWFDDFDVFDKLKDSFLAIEHKLNQSFQRVKTITNDLNLIVIDLIKKEQNGDSRFSSSNFHHFPKQDSLGDSLLSQKSPFSSPDNWNKRKASNTQLEGEGQVTGMGQIIDEIDEALIKCQDNQKVFKTINIQKIGKGVYKLENREYTFKILSGHNLAIRMFAGFIFTDSLVHFDEEMLNLIR